MTIAAGTKLGRYEIRSKLGEGGLGEVYLAQDTKLHRTVVDRRFSPSPMLVLTSKRLIMQACLRLQLNLSQIR